MTLHFHSFSEISKTTTTSSVHSAAVSPNGTTLVWGGLDNYIHVCNAATVAEIGKAGGFVFMIVIITL